MIRRGLLIVYHCIFGGVETSPTGSFSSKQLSAEKCGWYDPCGLLVAIERERERFTTSIQPAWLMRTGLCSCLSLLQQGNETMADSIDGLQRASLLTVCSSFKVIVESWWKQKAEPSKFSGLKPCKAAQYASLATPEQRLTTTGL